MTWDLVVIGGGPGGYTAAIRASQLGLRTVLVEEHDIGGTCLNRGCIPAKAMLQAGELLRHARNGEAFGVCSTGTSFDYKAFLQYRNSTTEQLAAGVVSLLKANHVTLLQGNGTLLPRKRVLVTGEQETVLDAEKVLLATGSEPRKLPLPGMDFPVVLDSDGLLALTDLPESLVIIGGGAIGVEFAEALSAMGTRVTILEAMPRLLPGMDREIGQNLRMILKRRGVGLHLGVRLLEVSQRNDRAVCIYEEKGKQTEIESQYVLCAVGRGPKTGCLFAEDVSLELDIGYVVTDEQYQTSVEGVYAIGDLIRGPQLAHAATAQGKIVAEQMTGRTSGICMEVIPRCVYTDPEIAEVGLTEEAAKAKGIPVKTGKFRMSANGRSLISREERGFVKIVADAEKGTVLGAQLMCARASDLIGELTTAVVNHLTAEQLVQTVRAHPSYNEGMGEALEDLLNGAAYQIRT